MLSFQSCGRGREGRKEVGVVKGEGGMGRKMEEDEGWRGGGGEDGGVRGLSMREMKWGGGRE